MSDDNTRGLIRASMDGTSFNNGGHDTVLYLDETMTLELGGVDHYLPVIAINQSPDYAPFLLSYRARFAQFFGPDYARAQELVEEINAERDYGPQDALDLVCESMALAEERRQVADE
jgi:hypothetical protein